LILNVYRLILPNQK